MRRFLTPLLLFIGVFLAEQLLQEYTYFYQEFDGLFLWSTDYLSQMFRSSLPLSGIIGDFLTQFFRYRFVAPALSALEVVLVFLLVRSILARFRMGWDVLAVFLACAAWLAIAFSPTAKTGVAILLFLIPVFLLSRLLPKRETSPLKGWAEVAGTLILLAGVGLFLSFSSRISSREKTATLRTAVATSDWDTVLSVATPEAVQEDRSMLPFAMMALGLKGQIGDRIFDYDIQSQDDFDMNEQEDSYVSLFFRGFLYDNLQCPNEAVHNFFQLATVQRHGQSYLVLRQLVADHYKQGNFTLARKYLAILSKSSCHGRFIRYYEDLLDKGTPRAADSLDFRKNVPLMSHDPFYNLFTLDANGFRTQFLIDRVLCTLLIREDLYKFKTLFLSVKDNYPVVPKYYQRALAMQDPLAGLVGQ